MATSAKREDNFTRKKFLDKSLFIARESAKSFLQVYKQKYRIELSDVSPFHKEKLKAEIKKQILEKMYMDQYASITNGKKPLNSILSDTFINQSLYPRETTASKVARDKSRTSNIGLNSTLNASDFGSIYRPSTN